MSFVRFFKYLFLFAFVYSAVLIITMPATFIWDKVKPYVANQLVMQKVTVKEVAGTLWRGQVLASVRGEEVLGDWDFTFESLLKGSLGLDLTVTSNLGAARGYLSAGLKSQFIELTKVDIDVKGLTPHIPVKGLVLDGVFKAENVRLVLREKEIIDSIGRLEWTGGQISYPAGRDIHKRTIPPFVGEIKWQSPNIYVGIRDKDARFDVIEATLDQMGWLKFNAKKRLLDIANEPWPQSAAEDQSVFSLRRKLL